MSSPTVLTQLTNPDPNLPNPSNMQDLVNDLNPLLTSQIQGDFTNLIFSSSAPPVDNNNLVWVQLDDDGLPRAIKKLYNGNWRRVVNGMYGEIKMFAGDPTDFFLNGLGLVGGEWDGWAFADGEHGTVNLSDRFIVVARMDNAAISAWRTGDPSHVPPIPPGWQTNVTGTPATSGGASEITLVNDNLPFYDVKLFGKVGYNDNNSKPSYEAIVTTKWYEGATDHSVDVVKIGAQPDVNGNSTQLSVPTAPPFYALAFVQFVGYNV